MKLTLLKLVSKDRAIIDLLRMEQGSRGFMNFLRSCAGAELTEFWEKEVRVTYEATREGGGGRAGPHL